MLRFLNFFRSKDSQPSTPIEPSFGSSRSSYQRSSSSTSTSDELDVTEDPEKQRARHRLLGAGLLVLVAIIGLPKVFDSEPKKVSNDVVLQMVASVVDPAKENKAESKSDLKTEHQNELAKDSVKDTGLKKEEVKPQAEDPKASVPASKSSEKALSQGEEVIEDVSKPKTEKVAAKYTVNIGSFPSAERAKKWGAKLKEQKIPYYTQERKKDDETVFMLRAGPFNDRVDAESAEKKIRAMGLNPKIVESK